MCTPLSLSPRKLIIVSQDSPLDGPEAFDFSPQTQTPVQFTPLFLLKTTMGWLID